MTTVLVTVVLVFVSILQLKVYRQQKAIMESSGQQTDKLITAADKQATAADKQATAASDQATAAKSFALAAKGINTQSENAVSEIGKMVGSMQTTIAASKEQMRLDQRAWVGIVAGENIFDKSKPTNPREVRIGRFAITLTNSGKTPARDVTNHCCLFLVRMPQAPIPDYDTELGSAATNKERKHGVIGPQVTQLMDIDFSDLADHEMTYSVKGDVYVVDGKVVSTNPPRAYIYVLGKFTYRDIFQGTKLHTTKFCFVNVKGNEFRLCTSSQWMD